MTIPGGQNDLIIWIMEQIYSSEMYGQKRDNVYAENRVISV
jgi:hypothetical protein